MKKTLYAVSLFALIALGALILAGCFTVLPAGSGGGRGNQALVWKAGDFPIDLAGRSVTDLAYGNGRFVAVSQAGRTAWSDDGGLSWNTVDASAAIPGTIRGIAYGEVAGLGRFVVVGDNAKTAYSTDGGETWTGVDASAAFSTVVEESKSIAGVAWGDGRFVAVGKRGKTAWSVDGQEWTAVDASAVFSKKSISAGGVTVTYDELGNNDKKTFDGQFFFNITGIAYGGGRFVAVSDSGIAAWSSDGGLSWRGNSLGIAYDFRGIAWGGERFAAFGTNGINEWSGNGGESGERGNAYDVFSYEVKGLSGKFSDRDAIRDIAYGGGCFVAVGANNKDAAKSNNAGYSSDGAVWIAADATPIFGAAPIVAAAYGQAPDGTGRFVVVDVNGQTAYAQWPVQ
jgi:hypothetical protein